MPDFAQLVHHTSEGIVVLDARFRILFANPSAVRLLHDGRGAADLHGRALPVLLLPALGPLLAATRGRGKSVHELKVERAEAGGRWVRFVVDAYEGHANRRYVCVLSDITAQKQAEADLIERSSSDVLTGLVNRHRFSTRLEEMLVRSHGQGLELALLYLDLDDFKQVNDRHGHSVGDLCLRVVAQRLRMAEAAYRAACEPYAPECVMARLGGDEFVAAFECRAPGAARHFLELVRELFDLPWHDSQAGAGIHASMGLALAPAQGRTVEQLMEHADRAMYAMKASRLAPVPLARGERAFAGSGFQSRPPRTTA